MAGLRPNLAWNRQANLHAGTLSGGRVNLHVTAMAGRLLADAQQAKGVGFTRR